VSFLAVQLSKQASRALHFNQPELYIDSLHSLKNGSFSSVGVEPFCSTPLS